MGRVELLAVAGVLLLGGLLQGACATAGPGSGTTRGLVMRAGARRLQAYTDGSYWIRRPADPGLRLPRLQEQLGAGVAGARVRPLQQRPAAQGELAFDVDRGGEIVALALAEQLTALGLRVGMEPPDEGAPDGGEGSPEVDLRGLRFLILLEGEARFWVRTTGEGPGTGSEATLDATVRVHALRGGVPTLVHTATAQEQASVDAQEQPLRGQRARAAARLALDQWLRRVLTDRAFEDVLLEQVRRR